MAKAKKLPSGSWRVLVFDHYEPVLNPDGTPVMQNGKPKQKRIYQSFTDDDPSTKGRQTGRIGSCTIHGRERFT